MEEYNEKVKAIMTTNFPVDCVKSKLARSIYTKHENKLFSNQVLTPVVDCLFEVEMSYSSPKGKINLYQRKIFTFKDMAACFESVSRTHLDRKTYSMLAAVERGKVSDSLRYDILQRDNFSCVLCGASARQGVQLHLDHIIPISKGGKSVPENLRTLCERCNIGKSNKIEINSSKK